jgi:hypothetical protein
VSKFHQNSVSTGNWIPKQSCALPNAKCKAQNASWTNFGGFNTFRTQKVSVHEQPIEEDIDSAREHGRCEN